MRRLRSLLAPVLLDYREWRALGPGGLPHHVGGWAVAAALRLLSRETTSVGMYANADARAEPLHLPRRRGARPSIAPWPIPHRQIDQIASRTSISAAALGSQMAAEFPDELRMQTSRFERRGPAVFIAPGSGRAPWGRAARGEAGHVHASDGSLHLVLHPADARAVIQAGWGERHPLAGVALLGIPTNYLMVYAPRDEEELGVVRLLFRRAVGD